MEDDMDYLIAQLEKEVNKIEVEKTDAKIENVQQRPPINENPKVQQQTVQPQQQPIQKNYQADQQKKQTEQIEQTQKQQQMQQIEKQFSTQQNQQQQIIQQQQQQKQVYNEPQPVKKESNIKQLNASTSKFIEQEQLYTIVPSFKSFNLIQQECSFITNTCMKQPSIESNSQSLAFYTNLRQALQKQLLQLIDFVEQGKLRDDMYGKFIAVTFKDQYALLQKAQSQGDTLFIKRITNRMNILKAEQTLMQQNPSENFAQIVQRVKPNIMIPQSQKQTLKKPQQLQEYRFVTMIVIQNQIQSKSIKMPKNIQKKIQINCQSTQNTKPYQKDIKNITITLLIYQIMLKLRGKKILNKHLNYLKKESNQENFLLKDRIPQQEITYAMKCRNLLQKTFIK